MTTFSQQGRLLQVLSGGPLAPEEAVATQIVGAEALSRPYRFTVDLLSAKAQVAPADVVGAKMGLLLFGHQQAADVHTARLVHGHVARWTELGTVGRGEGRLTHYRADLVPWLSLLALSAKTRTFEEKTVEEIVTEVFNAAGFRGQFRFGVTRALVARPYTVQYGESDLAFVSRLLEEEGLYYAFDHHSDRHFVDISDKRGSSLAAGTVPEMPFRPVVRKAPISDVPVIGVLADLLGGKTARSGADKGLGEAASAAGQVVGTLLTPLGVGGLAASAGTAGVGALGGLLLDYLFTETTTVPPDSVTEVRRERAVHTETASVRDFHLLRPAQTAMEITSGPGARGEYFTFLGDLAGTPEAGISEAEAARRMREIEAGRDVIRGASSNCALQPGTRVKIRGGIFGTSPVEFHVVEVGMAGRAASPTSADDSKTVQFVNEFVAIPVDTPYVPPLATPRPSVRGTQTAEVVGEGGVGAIDVDKQGRVKLMFPWDEGDGAARKSKHLVHVASPWAGVGWGAVQWPRVGQLVLVEFLEGDPARPIVTGRVYSREHPFPYAMPADKTQSGVKSRTLDGTAENFNELRFEDKKGEEHVFLQAERDLNVKVKRSETRTVGADRTTTVAHNDALTVTGGSGDKKGEMRYEMVEGDQFLLVRTGDQMLAVKQGKQVVWAQEGNQIFKVSKGDQKTILEDGNRSIKVEQGSQQTDVSGQDVTIADVFRVLAQTKIELEVGSSKITMTTSKIEIKVGGSTLTLDPASIKQASAQIEHKADGTMKHSAAMMTVEGSGVLKLAAPMVNAAGDALVKIAAGVAMHG